MRSKKDEQVLSKNDELAQLQKENEERWRGSKSKIESVRMEKSRCTPSYPEFKNLSRVEIEPREYERKRES